MFRHQVKTEGFQNGERGFERRIPILAKRAIQVLASKTGLAGNICHALGARNRAEGRSDMFGISRFHCFGQERLNSFLSGE
ncbi:hypothetical protein GGE07_005900 [Sinorhizobium terangae]|nr:hypothetical protein [Sinorhizobium terangae]